ncbi:MAG: LacI family DNA-binding transcriptional regulator [Parafilimonas sp.]
MRFEAATLKDIAKALGISTSTVSRALRDSYEISETTKQLVVDYAKNVNYKPNPIALSLKAKKSRSIGVIVPEISNNFFSEVINGIECAANYYGYNVIITQSFESYENEMDNACFLASRSIDGCLASVCAETNNFSHFTDLQQRGFPIVFFDRIVESLEGHTVTIDNEEGAYEITMHMLKNNYRRIAFLANPPNLYITSKRFEGYKKALSKYGIAVDESLIKYCQHDGMFDNEVEYLLQELFNNDNKPDAIFGSTDKLTIACLRYFKKHKIKVPDEVGLTGFSNLDITDLLCPSLTVVKQPAQRMGKLAAQLLIKTIESKRPVTEYEKLVLPVELKIGESSRPRLL